MPIHLLLSRTAAERFGSRIATVLEGHDHRLVHDDDVGALGAIDAAFLTRDITGNSTKYQLAPPLAHFCAALERAPGLRWVHTHSAGADRPFLLDLMGRGVAVTTSSGANAGTVAVTAVGGIIALARRFPHFMDAQRRHAWEPLSDHEGLAPADLAGQTAIVVGLGPIGCEISRLLRAFGLRVVGVRRSPATVAECDETIDYGSLARQLPRAQWLVLACPLSDRTRNLVDANTLALLPRGAHVVNVARGEVVVEEALIEALRTGALGGAFLDVFQREPLGRDSPLWDLPNLMVSPHTSSRSSGNYDRVGEIFLDNLARWREGRALRNTANT